MIVPDFFFVAPRCLFHQKFNFCRRVFPFAFAPRNKQIDNFAAYPPPQLFCFPRRRIRHLKFRKKTLDNLCTTCYHVNMVMGNDNQAHKNAPNLVRRKTRRDTMPMAAEATSSVPSISCRCCFCKSEAPAFFKRLKPSAKDVYNARRARALSQNLFRGLGKSISKISPNSLRFTRSEKIIMKAAQRRLEPRDPRLKPLRALRSLKTYRTTRHG